MIEQLIIAVCGLSSVWLSQDTRESYRRWACIFGLIAQPAWFWSAYQAQQWGILALCAVYTLGWLRGVRNHWMKD